MGHRPDGRRLRRPGAGRGDAAGPLPRPARPPQRALPRAGHRRGRHLPAGRRDRPHLRDLSPLRGRGQDGPDPDRAAGPGHGGRPDRGPRWDAGPLAHQRPRPRDPARRQAPRRHRRSGRRPRRPQPDLRRGGAHHRGHRRAAGHLHPAAGRRERAAVPDRQVPDDDPRRRRPAEPPFASTTRSPAAHRSR